jgi:hypothetical protein
MDPTGPGPDPGLNFSSPFLPCLGSVRIRLVDILILIINIIFVLMLEYCEHRFEFHKKEWAHVSNEAKDLIAGLLVKVRLCDLCHVRGVLGNKCAGQHNLKRFI